MKRFYCLILLLFSSFTLKAQPIISYIIPDIGTPNMNTYFEIIGPSNSIGNFGNDVFSLNNSGDNVRVEVLNPADSSKLIFGPIVVSWQGRMISGQAFVNPNVKPNTSDWFTLSNQFRIPFRVYINGKGFSNIDTFYIVRPQNLGNISGNAETIIGQGTLGKRSRRGAMIVDSLILGNLSYRISTNDCDPYLDATHGNQGYLPFILLTKGGIKGQINTTINVNGGFPNRQDAGPGGGGGGGRFYDVGLFDNNIGDDGGNGYIGGGPGGRNNSGIPGKNNAFKSYGIGTDSSAYSLNGNKPPVIGQYEASGGATAHPFGKSGEPCFNGDNCQPNGGFGGGSGNKQQNAGGSAGNAIDGTGPFSSKGLAVGNAMNVPNAGGSGGASGNPQGATSYSGNGGGGGGSISIFANKIENVSFSANGASGEDFPADGGSGAGGAIQLFSKIATANSNLDVSGGKLGSYSASYGRIRLDLMSGVVNINTVNAQPYIGFATDTSNLVFRNFTLTGKKPVSKNIKLYIKSESGKWQFLKDISTSPASWSTQISLPLPDSIFYLVALFEVENPNTTTYQMEPISIFSQSGANILRIDKVPHLVCDSIINQRYFRCENFPKTIKTKLYNTGDAVLNLEFQNASFFFKNKGFSLISPTGFKQLNPSDSLEIIVQFNPPNNTDKFFSDTLIFAHNDNSVKNPWKIAFNVQIDTVLITIQDKNDVKPITDTYHGLDILDLGTVCANEKVYIKDFLLQNFSSYKINIASVSFTNSDFWSSTPNKLMDSPPAINEQSLTISYVNKGYTGIITDTLEIRIIECPGYVKRVVVKLNLLETNLKILGLTAYGKVNLTTSKIHQFKIINQGTGNAEIGAFSCVFLILSNEFKIKNLNPTLPVILKPFIDTLYVDVEFTPSSEGSFSDSLMSKSLQNINSCSDSNGVLLTATGANSKIEVSTDKLDYGLSGKCAGIEKSFTIKNLESASTDLVILKRATIVGPDKDNFNIAQEPPIIPVSLPPGDSATYWVRYTGQNGAEGIKTAKVQIETDSPQEPVIEIDLVAEREDLHIKMDPSNNVNYGNVWAGFNHDTIITLTNTGRLDQSVFDIITSDPDLTVFPYGGLLSANSANSIDFKFTLKSTKPGTHNYWAKFIFEYQCKDSLNIDFSATTSLSDYTIPDSLLFGLLSPCDSKVDSIYIENNSNAPFIVKSISGLQGTDNSLFKLQNKIITYPDTVFPGEKRTIIVTFTPSNTTDGVKNSFIDIVLNVNGNEVSKRVYFAGTVTTGFLTSPPSLLFGRVIVNTNKTIDLVLENIGPWEVTVSNFTLANNYPLNYQYTNPGVIKLYVGNKLTIPITFSPNNIQSYNDSLQFSYQIGNCPVLTKTIYLIGEGVPAVNFTVYIPEIITEPTNDNLLIPVFGKVENPTDSLVGFNIDTIQIEFNRTLFFPKNIQANNGIILSNSINGNDRILDLNLRNIILNSKDTLLCYINGNAMLGDTDTTPLKITKIKYSQINMVSNINSIDGKLTIKICENGGKRLLKVNSPLSGIIKPNPSNGDIELDLDLLESGFYKIVLTDLTGHSETLDNFEISRTSEKHYSKKLILKNYSSGLYRILIQSPSEIYSLPLMIVK